MAYFIYNGKDSRDMGVILESLPPITRPKRRMETLTIPGRNGTLCIDEGTYESNPISLKCTLFPCIPADLPFIDCNPISTFDDKSGADIIDAIFSFKALDLLSIPSINPWIIFSPHSIMCCPSPSSAGEWKPRNFATAPTTFETAYKQYLEQCKKYSRYSSRKCKNYSK